MTRRALMLHLLREAGDRGVTTAELMNAGVGSRYSARLLELRELGHVVEAERIRDGAWKYTLIRDVERGIEPGGVGLRPFSPPAGSGVALGAAAPPPAPQGGGQHGDENAPPRVSDAEPLPTLFAVPGHYRDVVGDIAPGQVRAVRRQVG